MGHWERSEANANVAAFVERMNVVAKRWSPNDTTTTTTENVDRTMSVLRYVAEWADEHEPVVVSNGFFAMPSFRKFHKRLHADGHELLVRTYGRPGDHRTVELPVYLEHSFGDPKANTYGLEHELSFCMFLVALFKLHRLTSADERYIVPVLFNRYLDIVDRLIDSYRLEPTTEYGCWGLNDYWFVAFLWGSAQLAANADGVPSPASAITDESAAARRSGTEYVFLKCTSAVHRRQTERNAPRDEIRTEEERPLWSRSYQLWNLTAFRRWDRVNDCLMAAFPRLVLRRFEIVRRLVFGELLRFTRNPRPPGISFYNCIPAAAAEWTKTTCDRRTAAVYDESGEEEVGRRGIESHDDGEVVREI